MTHQQKFFFELLHVEQSTKIISLRIIYYADKKMILKSKQKIDHSNSFHTNRYNLVNKIQKALVLVLLNLILQKENENCL